MAEGHISGDSGIRSSEPVQAPSYHLLPLHFLMEHKLGSHSASPTGQLPEQWDYLTNVDGLVSAASLHQELVGENPII